MKYYQAEVRYKGTAKTVRFLGGSLGVLRSKAEPYIENPKVEEIVVTIVEDLGFFKIPEDFEEILKDKMIMV